MYCTGLPTNARLMRPNVAPQPSRSFDPLGKSMAYLNETMLSCSKLTFLLLLRVAFERNVPNTVTS